MRPQEADQPEGKAELKSPEGEAELKWPDGEAELKWEVEAVLAWHDEDARAAIAALLEDCRHLRHQLALAQTAMSPGFTRGWAPSFERKGFEQPGSAQE